MQLTRPIRNAIRVAALCCATELAAQTRSAPSPSSDERSLAVLIANRAGVRPLAGLEADTIRFEFRAIRFFGFTYRPTLMIRAEPAGYQGYKIEPPDSGRTRPASSRALVGDWGERVRQLESMLFAPPAPKQRTLSSTIALPVSVDGGGLLIEWRRGPEYRVWFASSELSACPAASALADDKGTLSLEGYICMWLNQYPP